MPRNTRRMIEPMYTSPTPFPPPPQCAQLIMCMCSHFLALQLCLSPDPKHRRRHHEVEGSATPLVQLLSSEFLHAF